jgi:hypothetical protein
MTDVVHWVIDSIIAERAPQFTGFPTLADAAREAGHVVHECRYIPIARRIEPEPALPHPPERPYSVTPVVYHGTYEGLRVMRRLGRNTCWLPLAYCREENLQFSTFAAHLEGFLLSDDFVILPYAALKRRGEAWLSEFCGETVFIRPNVVTKLFAGRAIRFVDFEHEINALNQVERVPDEALVVVANGQKINGEARFVIANGKVVTGSTYQWGGVVDIRPDVMPAQQALAERIAEHPWQADTVYVADIAFQQAPLSTQTYASLIELNSFSCAGLYACDTRKIVEAVGAAAIEEVKG